MQLKMQRENKKQAYDERVLDDIFNGQPQNMNLPFHNFIKTAQKDFELYVNQKLEDTFSKYQEKIMEEAEKFDVKTKPQQLIK